LIDARDANYDAGAGVAGSASLIKAFLRKHLERWNAWRRAPATKRDRCVGMVVGGIGFFWIGLFTLAGLHVPISAPSSLLIWFVAWIGGGALAGAVFPKVVTVVCFPFLTFGGGSS
jgi:hypothetical protein